MQGLGKETPSPRNEEKQRAWFPSPTFQSSQEGKWLAMITGGLKVTHREVNLPWVLIYVFLNYGQHPDGKLSNRKG